MAITPSSMSSSPTNSKGLMEDKVFESMAKKASERQVKEATQGFGFHSCALQIKDQKRSKWFYTQVLGMDVVKETESHDVTMIFLAFPNPIDSETPELEFGQRRGLLQLIHVAGSENEDAFRIRHGASGFCHLCVNVTDLEGALGRMQSMGVTILEPGTTEQGYAVIADPDGYSLQLLCCQIDQSRALKRQLEKIIISSSRDSTSRSLTANTAGGEWTETTNGSLPPPSGMPALSQFRGGSPNYQHPHWAEGAATGGSPLVPASPLSAHFALPAVSAASSTTVGPDTRHLNVGHSVMSGFEDLQASVSVSASSTAYSNGSNNGSGSLKAIAGQSAVRLVESTCDRSRVDMIDAPKTIDLTCVSPRPPLSARRKTAPNALFRTLSAYAKSGGHVDGTGGNDLGSNTHRSLPSSPNGTREKVAGTAAGGTYFFQRRVSTNLAPSSGPGAPAAKKFRDRLPFMGTRQR
ncbi:hypothetical protein BCV69DRAFT_280813 [Microstroma glucosiphilum]|uniref:VOC domain-containing protein n=1 Tax=Pseudomicrostroma glucosiphilum TaxID=1684307 RepID=A0A316UDG5_9BASI|nr:hypothetical protein BCV69DRAFT_280813 [Pseudomicrostroma glucosiphilum]PWN23202.1 hypothetical protein BCV69DRAFT_280813 [Pseudomicrostroma glucosiphilum]